MGAKAEALAKQFEGRVKEATAVLEKLNDADWKKTTAAEKWTVGVTAHHIAGAYEPVTHIITTIASGQTLPHFTTQMLDEMNAKHAVENATVTKEAAIELLERNSAAAAAAIRELTDEQLATAMPVSLYGDAPLTCQFVLEDHAVRHSYHHLARLKRAVA